ncbi:hypothetical protein [Streptomyces sp. NPDC048496]
MDDQRQQPEHEYEVGSGILHVFGQHWRPGGSGPLWAAGSVAVP